MARTSGFRTAVVAAAMLTALGAVLTAAAKTEAPARPPRPNDKLSYPKLNPIHPPAVVRETLPNGLKLLLVEDRNFPKIELSASVRGGRLAEPAGNPGLTELFGDVLRTGGVEKMSGDKVDELLDRLGASIESGVGDDDSSVSAWMLVESQDQVLPLFADFVRRPAFAQDKIDLAKTHLKSLIARRNDDVGEIAGREFAKLIYGAKSPYARQYEYEDVDKLGREALVAFHRRCFRPDQTIVAAWGDFDVAAMKNKLTGLLGDWKADGPAPKYEAAPQPAAASSINYIEKRDIEQTFIRLGHQSVRYDDPDYPALRVMSEILGGSFASRIFVKVRTEKGLAYQASGGLWPEYDRPGMFFFITSTKPSTTAEALSTVLDEMKKIREAPVTDDELRRAKEGYLNSYAFEYDSQAKIVNRLLRYEFYGYPEDFNVRLRDAVEKVTTDDVLRAARKHLHPELMTVLAIGRQDQFDKPLSTFGPVHAIDITIPEPAGEAFAAATPQSLARGKELLLQAARAKGERALAGLKDLTVESAVTQQTPMGSMDVKLKVVVAPPDRQFVEATTPMGTMVLVNSGPGGWMKFGAQTQPLPESQAATLRRGIMVGFGCAGLLQKALAGDIEGQALGPANFEGQSAEVVLVRVDDRPIRVFLSPADGQVLGATYHEQTEEGPAELTTVFSEPKVFDGLTLPQSTITKSGGQVKGTARLTSAKVNAGFDPAIFVKPAEKPAQ